MGSYQRLLPERHLDVRPEEHAQPQPGPVRDLREQRARPRRRSTRSYASNMADASYYVGACQQQCHATLAFDVGTNSALGYSGTNAGGRLIIQRLGVQPQPRRDRAELAEQRRRPAAAERRVPGQPTKSCIVIEHNVIKDNNNPNVPTSGSCRGRRHRRGDLRRRVRHRARQPDHPQRRVGRRHARLPGHRDAAARVALPGRHPGFPAAVRLPGARQQGLRQLLLRRRALRQRHQQRPGDRGAAADLRDPAELLLRQPRRGGPVTSDPKHIQPPRWTAGRAASREPASTPPWWPAHLRRRPSRPCPSGAHYPKQTKITMAPIPGLPSMPNPCLGVPRNGFCADHP